jgi:hypothetical protein
VINHAGKDDMERVEVFDVNEVDGKAVLKWARGYELDFPHILLNDVVALSLTEFYVSQHYGTPVSQRRGLPEWKEVLGAVHDGLFFKTSKIHFCKEDKCHPVAYSHLFNGMTRDDSGKTVYAVDSFAKLLIEYRVNKDKTLTKLSQVNLGNSPDNLMYYDGALYVGAFPRFFEVIAHKPTIVSQERLDAKEVFTGGAVKATKHGMDWKIDEVIM